MKVAIVYTSKYGSTQQCANLLSEKLEGVRTDVLSVAEVDPSINDYDAVILGIPIYSGSTNRDMRMFIRNNKDMLRKKLKGIFVMCWDVSKLEEYMENLSLSHILGDNPFICPGAVLDYEKMMEIEQVILKEYTGEEKSVSNIDEQKIEKFAGILKKQFGSC